MSSYKKFNLLVVLFGIITFLAVNWYWQNICAEKGCSSDVMAGILAPIRQAGIALAILAAPFLFLPAYYFRAWLKWLCSWFVPIAIILILATEHSPSGIIAFDREFITQALGRIAGGLTILFVLYWWWKTRKQEKVTASNLGTKA